MRTKQEQIEVMATILSNYCDKHNYGLHEPEIEDLAIELYNAGYGDVSEYKNRFEVADKVLTETRAKLSKAEHDRDRYNAEIKELNTNAEILARGVRDLNHENYELTEKIKQAQIDVLHKLQTKMIEDGIFVEICNWHINKLIEEIEK